MHGSPSTPGTASARSPAPSAGACASGRMSAGAGRAGAGPLWARPLSNERVSAARERSQRTVRVSSEGGERPRVARWAGIGAGQRTGERHSQRHRQRDAGIGQGRQAPAKASQEVARRTVHLAAVRLERRGPVSREQQARQVVERVEEPRTPAGPPIVAQEQRQREPALERQPCRHRNLPRLGKRPRPCQVLTQEPERGVWP